MLGNPSNPFTGPLEMKHTKLVQLFGLLVLTLFLGACERSTETPETSTVLPVETTAPDNVDQRLAAFFDEIFERDLSQNPELQAYLGRKTEDYGHWDDYSDEFSQTQAELKQFLRSQAEAEELSSRLP